MLVDIIVQKSGNHIVGGGDGVEVSGEVEIDLLHWEDLSISAAGCAALHSEAGAERRLAKSENSLLADFVKAKRKSY